MRITKLEPSKRKQGRWLVWMEDGSLLRVGEGDVVAFGLYAGMELTEQTIEGLTDAAALNQLKNKALNALTARPLSRRELLQKLTARRSGEEDPEPEEDEAERSARAASVADWLEGLGLLNDREYAKNVVRHCGNKGYGARRIQDELFRRGVPREYWDEALEERACPDEAVDAFLRSKLKGRVPDRKELKRVSDGLARRGFSWSEIAAGLRRYGAETEEE